MTRLVATFHERLAVEMLDEQTWILIRPLTVAFSPGLVFYRQGPAATLTVPAGFETDFASVPRIPFAFLMAGGIGERAAVIHDFLCYRRPCTYQVAADAFDACLRADGVPAWKRILMVRAVRWFGPRF